MHYFLYTKAYIIHAHPGCGIDQLVSVTGKIAVLFKYTLLIKIEQHIAAYT